MESHGNAATFGGDYNIGLSKETQSDMSQAERPVAPLEGHFVLSSQEDIGPFVEHISSKLDPHLFPQAQPLEEFLGHIYTNPGPGTVVFVDRIEAHVRPILDIYILWSSPITLSSQTEYHQMDTVGEAHDEFLERLEPSLDSLLHFITPVRYRTANDFQATLPKRLAGAKSINIIGSATFVR